MKTLGFILLAAGTLMVLDPQVVPVLAPIQSSEPLKALSAADDGLFQRLKPHFQRHIENEFIAAAKIHDPSFTVKELPDGNVGFIFAAGSIIASVVYAIVKAILISIFIAVVTAWVSKHILLFLGLLLAAFIVPSLWMLVIARLSCKATRAS